MIYTCSPLQWLIQIYPSWFHQRAGVTRQTILDRSSATIKAPFGSTVTPTGRALVLPLEALRILFMYAAMEGMAGLLLPRLLPWGVVFGALVNANRKFPRSGI
jgi:hypothetical protein